MPRRSRSGESCGAGARQTRRHVESYRANIVDARAVYVAISRARKLATLYTDSRADLTEALGIRDGAQVGAIDQTMMRDRPEMGAIGWWRRGQAWRSPGRSQSMNYASI